MTPAIEVNNLYKVYQPRNGEPVTAINHLSFTVNQGEFFALLGPNGAGKTSFISILAGPNRKTSGTIKVLGLDINEHREETKRLLGIVPQEISFDSFFTVNEVLILQSGYYGVKNNQAHIDEILEKLGLEDKKHSKTRALSGGMKRRLLIAKALVHKPKVVILDEPTAGVDVELRHTLWNYMRELNKQGTTILLTTHYLEEAESLCQRTAIIHKGKLVALDKTKELIKSLGNDKEMTLTFTHPLKKIPESLATFNPRITDHSDLKIHFGASDLNLVLKAIQDLEHISDLDLQGRSLEDVFMKLTAK